MYVCMWKYYIYVYVCVYVLFKVEMHTNKNVAVFICHEMLNRKLSDVKLITIFAEVWTCARCIINNVYLRPSDANISGFISPENIIKMSSLKNRIATAFSTWKPLRCLPMRLLSMLIEAHDSPRWLLFPHSNTRIVFQVLVSFSHLWKNTAALSGRAWF